MHSKTLKRLSVVGATMAAAALVAFLGSAVAGAGGGAQSGGQSPGGPAVLAFQSGGFITQVRIATQNSNIITSSTSYLNVAAPVYIRVPPRTTYLITADFTAETSCFAGTTATTPNWCLARILIGGVDAYPKADTTDDPASPFALDASDNGRETQQSYEGHAFSRSLCFTNTSDVRVLVPVVAQVKVTNTLLRFWVDDIHLRAMAATAASSTACALR
jgi:hypothetical protein